MNFSMRTKSVRRIFSRKEEGTEVREEKDGAFGET